MEKKIMIVIGLMILLGSCGELRYGVEKTVFEMEQDKETKERQKKWGGGAISNKNYESSVLEVIEDVLRRPINKHVQFGEITLLIPENTRLNTKVGNIVDEKTGYGIPIYFIRAGKHCSELAFNKKRGNENYRLSYLENNMNVSKIAQKIIRANGFTKSCN